MENFFKWMTDIVPQEEVDVWFNIHNIHNEKIELFRDIFLSLYYIISDTYLGDENSHTTIVMSKEDRKKHFEWCWNQLLKNFEKENIIINRLGEHKDYIESFFIDTFYYPINMSVKNTLSTFLISTFNYRNQFSKSDLDILTEIYKLLDKNIK